MRAHEDVKALYSGWLFFIITIITYFCMFLFDYVKFLHSKLIVMSCTGVYQNLCNKKVFFRYSFSLLVTAEFKVAVLKLNRNIKNKMLQRTSHGVSVYFAVLYLLILHFKCYCEHACLSISLDVYHYLACVVKS